VHIDLLSARSIPALGMLRPNMARTRPTTRPTRQGFMPATFHLDYYSCGIPVVCRQPSSFDIVQFLIIGESATGEHKMPWSGSNDLTSAVKNVLVPSPKHEYYYLHVGDLSVGEYVALTLERHSRSSSCRLSISCWLRSLARLLFSSGSFDRSKNSSGWLP
jgi:hypothetical protein